MDSSEQSSNSDLLSRAQTKHRRRLWISRALMGLLFFAFLYAAYLLLEWLVGAVLALTLGIVYLIERKRGTDSVADLHTEEPSLLLENLVQSLAQDYGIDEPNIVVTDEGDFNKHLFVTREDGEYYLCVSTVYLDLVSGDALAADLAHEFEHLTNRDLHGGKFRRYAVELFVNTAILIVCIIATILITRLIWGFSPISIHWPLPIFGLLVGSSVGFYLAMKWESRETEWLADIGSMKYIGPEQLARGFVEHQIIYGIPIVERIRDRLRFLLHTHPPTSARIRFAGRVSDISADEFVDSLDLEAIQENAEKYEEYTPDVDSE